MLSPPRHIARFFEAVGTVAWRHKGKLALAVFLLSFVVVTVLFLFTTTCSLPSSREARLEVNQIEQMVESYYLQSDPHRLPDSLDQLVDEGIVEEGDIPLDHWGNQHAYVRVDERHFFIASAGPDEELGTEDDIASVDDWQLCQHRATDQACR